ncbi:MAG: LL-diaminopimelate aminotransferase [Parvibaculales bacterium]
MVKQSFDIPHLPPYVFEEVNMLKAKERAEGRDVIDFGMGNPDLPTPLHIVQKLVETVRDPKSHRYSASRGIAGLRKAQARYYERRFGVKLDADKEIVATIGSKEGFANMAQAIGSKVDSVLVPNPTYPIHAFGFIFSGAKIHHMPVPVIGSPGEEFMSVLDKTYQKARPKPKVLVLNYPSNPTAQTASLDFYKEIIGYAKKKELIVLSDLAYAEIYFDDMPPPSILQVRGAKKIAAEFTSLSKSFSMPGWRVGFAVGNKDLVGALQRIKSYLDYGNFTPIQVAAIAALDSPPNVAQEIRNIYKKRRDVLVESFSRSGWDISPPPATMFAWAKLPKKYEKGGSLSFSKKLLKEAQIAVSPGIGFGKYGDKYVRIALVENEHRIRQAARNLKLFLGGK